MVTDYDCWHPDHGAVDVSKVIETLTANANNAVQVVRNLPAQLPTRGECPCGCDRALTHALLTAPSHRDTGLLAKLSIIAGRVL